MRHFGISHYVKDENQTLVEINRLEDLGFQLLPDWSDNELIKGLSELIIAGIHIAGIVFIVAILFSERWSHREIFGVNILVRLVYCYATVHIFRSVSYLSTSLPGPAAHCVDPLIEEQHKPKTIYDLFVQTDVFGNCGDLIYSGHMAGITTVSCTIIFYFNKLLQDNPTYETSWWYFNTPLPVIVLTIVCGITIFIQALFCIGTRNHYTVDTFLGIIIGYWNFIWHLFVLRPTDMSI